MKRSILATAATLSLCLITASFTSACLQGAPLENKGDIAKARGCDMDALLEQNCSGSSCHEGNASSPTPYGGVDLFTSDVPNELIGLGAVYFPPANDLGTCPTTPELIIDPVNPQQSLLLKKLRGQQTCGDKMPYEPKVLTQDEVQCFEDWVLEAVAAQNSGSTAQ